MSYDASMIAPEERIITWWHSVKYDASMISPRQAIKNYQKTQVIRTISCNVWSCSRIQPLWLTKNNIIWYHQISSDIIWYHEDTVSLVFTSIIINMYKYIYILYYYYIKTLRFHSESRVKLGFHSSAGRTPAQAWRSLKHWDYHGIKLYGDFFHLPTGNLSISQEPPAYLDISWYIKTYQDISWCIKISEIRVDVIYL
jgi:hypothetical protein